MSKAAAPVPPINVLCDSEQPMDIIARVQSVLRFIQDAKGDDGDEEDEAFLDGRRWLWMVAQDALTYAQQLTDPSCSKAVQS